MTLAAAARAEPTIESRSRKRNFPPKNLRRYHYRIWFPQDVGYMAADFFQQFDEVNLTNHAAEQLLIDKRGIIKLPTKEMLLHPTNTLVEFYEVLDRHDEPQSIMQKAVIRVHNLDDKHDYSYVISREGYMISAWATDKSDHHRLTESAHLYWCPDHVRDDRLAAIRREAEEFERTRAKTTNIINFPQTNDETPSTN
jgi:hypothetical protein